MAEFAVGSAVQMLQEVIKGAVLDEIKHLRGVRDDVLWLREELECMKRFLVDAEQQRLSGDELAKKWVGDVTDTAYRAEDVAATLAARRFTIGNPRSDSSSTGCWSCLEYYLPFWFSTTGDGVGSSAARRYVPSIFRLKQFRDIGNEIKELKKEIEEIQKRNTRYRCSPIHESSSNENKIREMRRMPLFQNEGDVFGLENDKKRVMELLQAKESRRYVIGIVGMGGMGKTTLAWQVFKSINRSQFPKLAWVVLSEKYIQNHSIHKLLYEIAEQVIPNSPGSESMRTENLSELLKSNLKDERYLIVMDDMWETDVWDLIKGHLPDTDNGSRIIITTRKEIVAEHPALHFPFHRMEGLDDKHSWDLFTHLVFGDEGEIRRECIGELKDLAEVLVHGCGGSPLALTVLGGMLAGKEKTRSAWQDVLGNKKWLRGEEGNDCLEIIKLSYRDLPHHQKCCFLYLSAFPEDHEIEVEKLIRLWVAEGFVAKTDTNNEQTEEDIARTYLKSLKQRCLVRVFYAMYGYDCFEYCVIHDMVRELSISEAKEANFINSEIKDGGDRVIHRLSLQGKFSFNSLISLEGTSPSLRTLLNFKMVRIKNFKHFNLLRVLDLEGARINELPEEVGDMILLRYLSIKYTNCWFLPNSISKLSYLETLDCRKHPSFRFYFEIPDNVWKMKTLKHILGVTMERQLDISHLVKLQTLVGLGATPYFLHSLLYLTHLRMLSLEGELGWSDADLVPMDIWKAMGRWPFLKFLYLSIFQMEDVVCEKEGFPRLQRLSMDKVDFDSWEVEKGSMPSLECINMIDCKGLKRLPNGLAQCKKLRIIHCTLMSSEFEKWFENGIKDDSWEFRYVEYKQIRR